MAEGKRKKPGANGRGRRQVPNLNNPKSRVLQNPPKALDQSRGIYGITGLILGALAGGFVLLVESVLSPLLVYLVNIVALYVARYASAIIYGAATDASSGGSTAGITFRPCWCRPRSGATPKISRNL